MVVFDVVLMDDALRPPPCHVNFGDVLDCGFLPA
jgi:hypothetical protein